MRSAHSVYVKQMVALCTMEGMARYSMHATNRAKKQNKNKPIIEPKIAVNTYLPVQQALAESRENTDMSLNHHT